MSMAAPGLDPDETSTGDNEDGCWDVTDARDGFPGNDPETIVIFLTDDRAIVVDVPSETGRSRWGRRISDLTRSELAPILGMLDPVTKALIEARRLTGSLVELDLVTREMWSTAKKVTEEGGWVQATLRDEGGHFAHMLRVRPASALSVMAGGASILGAIATQAQTAEMARDIKAIRQRVDTIYQHLQSDQKGAVANAVEQVEELVERLRAHGERGIDATKIGIIETELGLAKHQCMVHLTDAIARVENASQGSPHQAEKHLSKEDAAEVRMYLDLLGEVYAATVQLGLARIACDYHEEKPDVASTDAEKLIEKAAKFRAEIDDVRGRLGRLDEGIRARFRRASERVLQPTAASGAAGRAAAAAVRKGEGTSGIAAPAMAAAAGLLAPLAVGGVNAVVQSFAEKKLDERLGQLTDASSRSSRTMDQATPALEALLALTKELAGFGG